MRVTAPAGAIDWKTDWSEIEVPTCPGAPGSKISETHTATQQDVTWAISAAPDPVSPTRAPAAAATMEALVATRELDALRDLVEAGKLRMARLKSYALEDILAAFNESAGGHVVGKLGISVPPQQAAPTTPSLRQACEVTFLNDASDTVTLCVVGGASLSLVARLAPGDKQRLGCDTETYLVGAAASCSGGFGAFPWQLSVVDQPSTGGVQLDIGATWLNPAYGTYAAVSVKPSFQCVDVVSGGVTAGYCERDPQNASRPTCVPDAPEGPHPTVGWHRCESARAIGVTLEDTGRAGRPGLAVADGPLAHVKKCKPRARLSDSQLWTFVKGGALDGHLVSNGSAVTGGTPVALSTDGGVTDCSESLIYWDATDTKGICTMWHDKPITVGDCLRWSLDATTGFLTNAMNGECVTLAIPQLKTAPCDPTNQAQLWELTVDGQLLVKMNGHCLDAAPPS